MYNYMFYSHMFYIFLNIFIFLYVVEFYIIKRYDILFATKRHVLNRFYRRGRSVELVEGGQDSFGHNISGDLCKRQNVSMSHQALY